MSAIPAVSVVLPVHNRPEHLAAAAASILTQTRGDLELVMVDDCSDNPATGRAIAALAAGDGRVRVVRRARNGGAAAARNSGAAAARAELIAFMDADDVSEPRRLEKQLDFLSAHPEVASAACRKIVVDGRGRFVRHYSPPRTTVAFSRPLTGSAPAAAAALAGAGDDFPAACVGGKVPFNHSTVARRECYAAVGGFRECYRAAEDHDMTLRFQERFAMAELPEELYRYREFRGERVSTSQHNWRANIAIDISTFRRRAGLSDPMAEGRAPDDEFILAHFGELPAARRRRFIGKFAGPARRLMRAGQFAELRRLLAFAEKLCGDEEERRVLSRVRLRVNWWAAVLGKWGFWSGRD